MEEMSAIWQHHRTKELFVVLYDNVSDHYYESTVVFRSLATDQVLTRSMSYFYESHQLLTTSEVRALTE